MRGFEPRPLPDHQTERGQRRNEQRYRGGPIKTTNHNKAKKWQIQNIIIIHKNIMNQFRNFPASEFMSDFEIVELQNEMLRLKRRQEESDDIQKSESSESDSDDDEFTFKDSSTLVSQGINLSDDNIASDLEEDEFLLDIPLQDAGLLNSSSNNSIVEDGMNELEVLSGNNDSNDSNQSMYSTSSKTPPKQAETIIHIANTFQQKNSIPIDLAGSSLVQLCHVT